MFAEHPFTGVGQGAFRAAFVDAKAALLERGAVFFERQPFPVFANAHNEPLEVAAETGLPGLLALGWALWLIGRRLRAGVLAAASGERALAAAGLGALALLSLTGFPFRIAVVAFPGAALPGLAAGRSGSGGGAVSRLPRWAAGRAGRGGARRPGRAGARPAARAARSCAASRRARARSRAATTVDPRVLRAHLLRARRRRAARPGRGRRADRARQPVPAARRRTRARSRPTARRSGSSAGRRPTSTWARRCSSSTAARRRWSSSAGRSGSTRCSAAADPARAPRRDQNPLEVSTMRTVRSRIERSSQRFALAM